ncbi:energy-coupling factor transporter transmembrane protein EcfT [Rhodobacter sp. Har01]|uniref:energy-coupling factor transporter transmembrane component T n=1 Tax=Rhodobacter sp. Har01 TaxID=2883999 RepID=UPI001D070579|nr:energy-coupling factor transporter transmembrane component T [Rhodobacter sp. Har01]MCB6179690.1 energy-coupling factor transporter transmembrane protein EcfT [Rhodobacter sp. Har01]
MLTLTSPVRTPLDRLPASAKLAALAAGTVLLFWLTSPWALALALAGVVGLHLPWGRPFAAHAARMLRPLWPFVVVVAGWHLWTGEIASGTAILLRMVTAVAAANLVTMTTRLSDMLAVFEWLALPLSPLLPPRRLALAFALVIRFVPTLSERMDRILEAWRARSPRRPGWRVVVPLTLAALDDADHAAEALRARGGAG